MKKKEDEARSNHPELCKMLINLSSVAYRGRAEKQRCLSYYHYSSSSLEELQATNRRMLDDRDSEAQHVRAQKASS
jgi:hypothetical protein